MTRPLSIVVIDSELTSRNTLKQVVASLDYAETIAETDSLVYGYELIRQNQPDVVFVDLGENPQKTLEVVERISTYFKQTLVVVSGFDLSLDSIMASMHAGAREYLHRPMAPEKILDILERQRKVLTRAQGGDRTGRILTVFSNKGGLGKTTIAVNLALSLSEVTQKPVALVDLNLQLGDITTFLDVTPKQTIVDIAKNVGRVDAAYLESSLAEFKYGNSQLYILADPLQVEEGEEVTADQINTVLTVLKASFEYVIIDTNTSFDSKTLTALDLADNILLVSMVNLPCIRSTQRLLSLFQRLDYDKQKIKVIVNRYIPDEEITIQDVEDILEHEIFWKIPNNYFAVMSAINRGVPLPSVENGEAVYRNFLQLAYQISGVVNRPQEAQKESSPLTLAPSIGQPGKAVKGVLGKIFKR